MQGKTASAKSTQFSFFRTFWRVFCTMGPGWPQPANSTTECKLGRTGPPSVEVGDNGSSVVWLVDFLWRGRHGSCSSRQGAGDCCSGQCEAVTLLCRRQDTAALVCRVSGALFWCSGVRCAAPVYGGWGPSAQCPLCLGPGEGGHWWWLL